MEAQRTQKEINAQVSLNRQNNELNLRMGRIEKNIELILELLAAEKVKATNKKK